MAELFEAVVWAFTEGEGEGAVGELGFYGADDVAEEVVGEEGVFAALEDEGAEAEGVACAAALEYLFFGEAVAAALDVAPQATIETIVATVAGDFDEAAHEDAAAVDLVAEAAGFGKELVDSLGVAGGEEVVDVEHITV